ncbi:MAG: hypothetical protein IH595_00845 [Bacteroidales bacterium]|nr:hypothetical protein [Bacteroidales bacterium]
METYLNWKREFFSNRYSIYAGNRSVGELKCASFSRKATATLFDKKYSFKTKGFFKEYTLVYEDNKLVGKINHWGNKQPRTLFEDMHIKWQYDNKSKTQWSVFDSNGMSIKYNGTRSKGSIEVRTDNYLIVLCGLFVSHYYWQAILAAVVVIFIPLWVHMFH